MIGHGTVCYPRSLIIAINQMQARCSVPVDLLDVDCKQRGNQRLCTVHWIKRDCSVKPYLFTEYFIITLRDERDSPSE